MVWIAFLIEEINTGRSGASLPKRESNRRPVGGESPVGKIFSIGLNVRRKKVGV